MDLTNLARRLLAMTDKISDIETALLFLFMNQSGHSFRETSFFNQYFSDINMHLVNQIEDHCIRKKVVFDLYTLVEIFELLIPDGEKKINGMVYTPPEIKDFIIKSMVTKSDLPKICDPACGCGSFLLSAAEYLHKKYNCSYKEIFETAIYGVDIIPHNIDKATILFRVLAHINGEVIEGPFNLKVEDSLSLDWDSAFKGIRYDYIIGNPPYVRSKNIQDDVKKNLRIWKTARTGNVDLYIPFYELGLKLLNPEGKLGYISVNTFLKSVNGRGLRNLLIEQGFETYILDFKDMQIFKKVTSYTCITIINKNRVNGLIHYAHFDLNSSFDNLLFHESKYAQFKRGEPWSMGKPTITENLAKIESIGVKLSSYKIRNGLATLKNDIYFFRPIRENNKYYVLQHNNVEYLIEKEICIDVAKPNVIKTEQDLKNLIEKAIFPYTIKNEKATIIPEAIFKIKYPNAYTYLVSMKETLDKRDKGKGSYPEWYAYGRTQGMNNFGRKLFIPYMANSPAAVISEDVNTLFYCGYAIFIDDVDEMCIVKKLIESDVFWYYIKNTSKPYANGYFSLAKNYLQEFGIPVLSSAEKDTLLRLNDKNELNKFIDSLYQLKI